jgi:O-antigen/teichoic acid export membrane protein
MLMRRQAGCRYRGVERRRDVPSGVAMPPRIREPRGWSSLVRDRSGKLIDKARGAVPEGTFAVGAGLGIAAVTSYLFVIVANKGLSSQQYSAFGAFWGFIFVAGPGLFLPLEQEVGRALAHRKAQGIGGGPLVHRAARLGAILTAATVVLVLVTSPLYVDGQFHGNWLLVASLAIGLVGFYCMHTTRGTLSGNARFRPYGEMLATEAVVRLGGALVLLAVGVNNAGAYGMCMALAPFVAVAVSLRKRDNLLEPGPPAPYSELSNALGWLLAGSVLMQLLGYSSLLGVNVLKGPGDTAAVAAFTSAFFVARIPPLLFQAVQGTLLPKLAGLAGAGRHDDFRTGLKQLLLIVVGIAVIGTIAAFTIGVPVGKILFPPFKIDSVDLGLLAAGSGMFIISLTVAQAILALKGHKQAALAWLLGVLAFVAVAAVAGSFAKLEMQVELGFLVGAAVSTIVMGAVLASRLRRGVPVGGIEGLITQIEHEPLEI